MSSEAIEGHHGGAPPVHDEDLHHQFEDMAQQNDAYVVGMWTFLVTEVMFFGALFLAYLVYRRMFPAAFVEAHEELNVTLGTVNTLVLLTSSLSMAMAVYFAQIRQRVKSMGCIAFTLACALTFLVVKGFEWKAKFESHHVPGFNFKWTGQTPSGQAEMFFNLYFAMTGLHALHVIIGIAIMVVLLVLMKKDHKAVRYYMPIEMTGLYWHFVDIVWIFLFPLFYLIPKH